VTRGPQVFAGYADGRAASFHEGWLKSDDLGRIGVEGEVYVVGRIKDVIIRGGHNIDPAGIEDAAMGRLVIVHRGLLLPLYAPAAPRATPSSRLAREGS
jgi:acyl-CoA synthetase (AMP-forming)/AMP-acid ligase II